MARKVDEIDDLFQNALNNSQKEFILVEKFIEGPQISTESILIEGEIYAWASLDSGSKWIGWHS